MRDVTDVTDKKKYHKKILLAAVATAVVLGTIFFISYFYVDTVRVMGSSYYTEDEIKDMVLKGPLAKNSILAPILYTKDKVEDIPFVKGITVSQDNNHTICISVNEVELVGCVKYLDCYMYFDRSGTIVASTVERKLWVPYFEGIQIQNIAFGDELTFPHEDMLNTAISLARIFQRSEQYPDHINYDDFGNITLTYGTVKAQLGSAKYLDDKMMRLSAILEKIQDQTGILHLENVTDSNKIITFEKEMTDAELANQQAQEETDSDQDSEDTDEDTDEDQEDDSQES